MCKCWFYNQEILHAVNKVKILDSHYGPKFLQILPGSRKYYRLITTKTTDLSFYASLFQVPVQNKTKSLSLPTLCTYPLHFNVCTLKGYNNNQS